MAAGDSIDIIGVASSAVVHVTIVVSGAVPVTARGGHTLSLGAVFQTETCGVLNKNSYISQSVEGGKWAGLNRYGSNNGKKMSF